jgi:sortase A
VAALLVAATMWGERRVARVWDDHLLRLPSSPATARPPGEAPPRDGPADPLLGRLDVPRIGLSAAVREGVDDATLDVAVGHVPGSAQPGCPGNAALAAHRDAEFRPLRRIRVGDEIQFVGRAGESRYRVVWTRVVKPDRTDVVRPVASGSVLTLVTCYPFAFIGRAPLRFVVRATRI